MKPSTITMHDFSGCTLHSTHALNTPKLQPGHVHANVEERGGARRSASHSATVTSVLQELVPAQLATVSVMG